jgi:hypothetical protein
MLLQAAYLALTQFFDYNSELVLLLVNTLLSDLKSDNFINGVCSLEALVFFLVRSLSPASALQRAPLAPRWCVRRCLTGRSVCRKTPCCGIFGRCSAVSTGLVVTTKLIGPDLINAVYPMVVERLKHPKLVLAGASARVKSSSAPAL